jgi:signal transduction histidine kinase
MLRDVTEHRRAVEHLRHSQRMEVVGEFASTIAHDVNNLSTVILGYAHLAANESPADAGPSDELAQINKAADSIAALTRQLLAFSRRQVLEPALLDVADTIGAIGPAVRSLVGKGVDLVIRHPPPGVTVRADEGQLEQVILNLVLNARDATAAGDTITVEAVVAELDARTAADGAALSRGAYVGLRVGDTGIGMDESTRERCFEPFFTTKPLGRGTGLGLATVSAIAQRHGGGADVESAPGEGSVFTVWLPRAPLGARAAVPTRAGH